MHLLQALNINPVNAEAMLFSCKIHTRILAAKVIGHWTADVLLNDVYLGNYE
jgi:hypothetical protein